MADVLVQFHTTVEELTAFIDQVIADVPVHLTALRIRPFRVASVEAESLEATVHDPGVSQIVLTLHAPVLGRNTMNAFLGRNSGSLVIDIGRLSDQGLDESCLFGSN